MSNSLQEAEALIHEAINNWPSPFVTRKGCEEISSGAISAGTLANLDCKGKGPEGAFKIGRTTCYPKAKFGDFLISRLSTTEKVH